jgi:DNA polymerase III delta prime subunit
LKVNNKRPSIINHQTHYHILDLNVCLDSDSKELIDLFDKDYGWFKAPSRYGEKRLDFYIRLNDPKNPFVRTNSASTEESGFPPQTQRTSPPRPIKQQSSINDLQSLKGHPNPVSCAHQTILRHLFNALDDFVVLHAGVVARGNQAAILAGPPGVGKTTLVLRLLEEGFTFFSDDFCPIHKESGLVHPFPRSVCLVDRTNHMDHKSGRKGKTSIAPDQLGVRVGDAPYSPGCIICLDPGECSSGFCELEIGLKEEHEAEFISDLRKLDGIALSGVDAPISEWRITYPNAGTMTGEVREYLKRHEHRIWNVYRNDKVQPDFERAPVLSPISTHEAAFHLLRDLKQDRVFGREEEGPNDLPGRFFAELNELLNGIPCCRLTVGRLEDMSGLIKDRWFEGVKLV